MLNAKLRLEVKGHQYAEVELTQGDALVSVDDTRLLSADELMNLAECTNVHD
jgi:hypothetical protein